jgi:hypothetical protein
MDPTTKPVQRVARAKGNKFWTCTTNLCGETDAKFRLVGSILRSVADRYELTQRFPKLILFDSPIGMTSAGRKDCQIVFFEIYAATLKLSKLFPSMFPHRDETGRTDQKTEEGRSP